MNKEHAKNMISKTLDIIGFYSLTGSAAYKVAPVKSFPLGQVIVPFKKKTTSFSVFITTLSLHCFPGDDVCTFFYRIRNIGTFSHFNSVFCRVAIFTFS